MTTESLEAITRTAVSLALDAASLRHQAIAANIANAGAVDRQPLRLDFESQLDDIRRDLAERGSVSPAALAAVQPRLVPALDADGQPLSIRLDREMADMSANAVQYQALLRGLSRHFAVLYSAASDGRK